MESCFWWGVFGGLIPEFYALYKLRKDFSSEKPVWVTSYFYWSVTLVMIALGGGIVLLYESAGAKITTYVAVHIGAATPTLIGNFLSEKPLKLKNGATGASDSEFA